MSKREWFYITGMTTLVLACIIFSAVITKHWWSWFNGFSLGFTGFSTVTMWMSFIRLHRARHSLREHMAHMQEYQDSWGQRFNRAQIRERTTPAPPANLYSPGSAAKPPQ